MKQKIGIVVDDIGFQKYNFNSIAVGNPGIGGTQYLMIYTALLLNNNHNFEINILHINENKYPVKSIRFNQIDEIIDFSIEQNYHTLIFAKGFIKTIGNTKNISNIRMIYWAHNFINWDEYTYIKKNKNIEVVFVGNEQRDKYLDSHIISKSYVIQNVISSSDELVALPSDNNKSNFVFMGALVEYKGFHVLAKVWIQILKEIPEAKLHVIGSGNLYNDSQSDGLFTPTTRKYEKKFIKYIQEKKVFDSIIFYGKVGKEKNEILKKCTFGIFNPLCKEETFGLTILEMQQHSICVIAGKSSGTYELISRNKNGFIFKNKNQLKRTILKAYKNLELDEIQPKLYYDQYSNIKSYNEKWTKLLTNIDFDKKVKILGRKTTIKKIKMLLYKTKITKVFSLTEVILFLKFLVRKITSNVLSIRKRRN
jgi:glycosyltransferase involved in cell wall biosynthesis